MSFGKRKDGQFYKKNNSTKTHSAGTTLASGTSLTQKYTRPALTGYKLGTDVSRKISTRFGRGTFDVGFHVIIDEYNNSHPDNKLDHTYSGIGGVFAAITEYDDEQRWERRKEQWDKWIQEPDKEPIRKIIADMQVEVDSYNDLMTYKYNYTDTFFRGTNFEEIEGYAQEGDIGAYAEDDFDFIALTMNPSQAKSTFNQGVVIEYDADFIRKSRQAKKTEYTMDNVPILAIDHDSTLSDLERIDSKQNALFVDEQEIRVEKYLQMEAKAIKSIRIYPEKMGYERMINELDDDELIAEFKNRGTDTPRVWTLNNSKRIEESFKKQFNNDKEFTGMMDNVKIDFQHKFPSGLF